MSTVLPIQEPLRELILEAAGALQPHVAEITATWRKRMFDEFQFEGRIMVALERLNLGVGFVLFSHSDFHEFNDNLCYYGRRLAKLRVDTRQVARALEIYLQIVLPYVGDKFGERRFQMIAALETFTWASFIAVSGAYFDVQQSASGALLKVLDAELSAKNLSALLERILVVTAGIFGAKIGFVLLADPESNRLGVCATTGLPPGFGDGIAIAPGQGFTGQIFQSGEPDILPDLAQASGLLNPGLRGFAQSLWGVPLKISDGVIGVLVIGFEKPYQWLPTELELFRAVADRSALAIDRARMTDALREREIRIVELSGHLLKAQEEERKRISRELHDETGQALMVIRLYLGMLDGEVKTRDGKARIGELLSVVDRTIEGIRRIIGRLSPLVLEELGLVSAIRKEAKDLTKTTGVRSRVVISDDVGRLDPAVETAIYRVVQEGLHNVAKHAKAQNVNITIERKSETLKLVIEDDGIGIRQQVSNPLRPSFGIAGMQERISTLGGQMKVSSRKSAGTRITVTVPAPSRHKDAPPLETRKERASVRAAN